MLRAKSWLERIHDGRDPNQTKVLKIIVHENLTVSQGGSKRESNEEWDGNRFYVDMNAHKELIARIEQLEKSAQSTQPHCIEQNRKGSL